MQQSQVVDQRRACTTQPHSGLAALLLHMPGSLPRRARHGQQRHMDAALDLSVSFVCLPNRRFITAGLLH